MLEDYSKVLTAKGHNKAAAQVLKVLEASAAKDDFTGQQVDLKKVLESISE